MGGTLKRISLTGWIFIGMAAGIATGLLVPDIGSKLAPASNIFLRLIKSIIAPLLFGTLVYGIAGAGNIKTMGRIGLKSIVYFEVVTTLALVVGLSAVNIVQPGQGAVLKAPPGAVLPAAPTGGLIAILEHTFPVSVVDAMAKGEVLQLVVFSFMFGAACSAIGERARPVVEFCESLAEVMFEYTRYVMYLAPIGAGAAMAVTVSLNGPDVLLRLGKLVLTLYGSLVVFVVFVLGAVIMIARIPLKRFFAAAKEPWLIAFSTASSESALPLALENMQRYGVPKHIVAFVLPTGYSFNLDGTTLYLSLASVFIAQAAGVHMSIWQQVVMLLTLMLTSKGVAGVPRASLVILIGTLATFNLPIEGVGALMGVDALMDMARTSVNVLGNCLAAAVVGRWEGYDPERVVEAAAEESAVEVPQ